MGVVLVFRHQLPVNILLILLQYFCLRTLAWRWDSHRVYGDQYYCEYEDGGQRK